MLRPLEFLKEKRIRFVDQLEFQNRRKCIDDFTFLVFLTTFGVFPVEIKIRLDSFSEFRVYLLVSHVSIDGVHVRFVSLVTSGNFRDELPDVVYGISK